MIKMSGPFNTGTIIGVRVFKMGFLRSPGHRGLLMASYTTPPMVVKQRGTKSKTIKSTPLPLEGYHSVILLQRLGSRRCFAISLLASHRSVGMVNYVVDL